MEPKLWAYWEGERTPFLNLCITTLQRHNSNFCLMTPKTIAELPKGNEALDFTKGLPLPYRSDYLRYWLIYHYGGAWIDCDCIALRKLDICSHLKGFDFVGIVHPSKPGRVPACPFAGVKESDTMYYALELCKERLEPARKGKKIPYGSTSVGINTAIAKRFPEKCNLLECWQYNRVPWNKAKRVFFSKETPRVFELDFPYTPYVQTYHLTNPIPNAFKKASEMEVLNNGTFAAFLLQKALGKSPAIPLKTQAILKRLKNRPYVGVEVGVFEGINSRNLLTEHPLLTLIGVDPYKPTEFHGSNYWNRIKQTAVKVLNPFNERFRYLYLGSVEASKTFEDNSLDFVFIDAEHTLEALTKDLNAWFPKVKQGGWIGGHDYSDDYPGVIRALEQFGEDYATDLDHTWFIQK